MPHLEQQQAERADNAANTGERRRSKANDQQEAPLTAEKRRATLMVQEDQTSGKVSAEAQAFVEKMEDSGGNGDAQIGLRLRLHGVLGSKRFDQVMGFVILFNAFTIGYESNLTALQEESPSWIVAMEYVFLAIYTTEIFLRYYVYRKAAFVGHGSDWVKFDAFLVLNSWCSIFANIAGMGDQGGFLSIFKLLRTGKLVRPLRVVAQFRTLWLLVRGLLSTFFTICYTVILISLFIFIFACLAIELIAKDAHISGDIDYQAHVAYCCRDLNRIFSLEFSNLLRRLSHKLFKIFCFFRLGFHLILRNIGKIHMIH